MSRSHPESCHFKRTASGRKWRLFRVLRSYSGFVGFKYAMPCIHHVGATQINAVFSMPKRSSGEVPKATQSIKWFSAANKASENSSQDVVEKTPQPSFSRKLKLEKLLRNFPCSKSQITDSMKMVWWSARSNAMHGRGKTIDEMGIL